MDPSPTVSAVAAMLGVLIFDTLPGLLIGVLDSVLLLIYPVSRPHVAVLGEVPGSGRQRADTAVHPEDQTMAGSRCCGSSRACSSATPTTCTMPLPTPQAWTAPGRSCWTARPRRPST